jgi:hypothetical protein
VGNGRYYECTSAGTSGLTPPTWPTADGGTVVDGGATWTCRWHRVTLPALTGYPGVVRVWARAVQGAVEERNQDVLELEFGVAGAFTALRPNTPAVQSGGIAVTASRTIGVQATYDSLRELGTATQLQMFIRVVGGSYNYASADATTALSGTARLRSVTLSATRVVDGWCWVRVLAATAAGVQSDPDDAAEYLVWTSAENTPAPTGAVAYVARA